ncbi:MAG: Fic family protein [Chloroflexota bacterium]
MESLVSQANSLYLDYGLTDGLRENLNRWDSYVSVAASRPMPDRWDLAIQPSLRSATVAGSTGIEGNPLTVAEVADVLSGGAAGDRESQREVTNYNEAMNIATTVAARPDFVPEESLVQLRNATVTRVTPTDTHGIYRSELVTVDGFYSAPNHSAVPGLVARLIGWWGRADEHPLITSALLHLNMAAIHPWTDGNGRTARVLASLVMMRTPLRNPDVISLESCFRANRSEYFDQLATVIGQSYQPDRHSVTPWLEYYVRLSTLRLDAASQLNQSVRQDMGTLLAALGEAGHPYEWAPILLAASLYPLQTSRLARAHGRSEPAIRHTLAHMVTAGWLQREGRTRGTRYFAGERLSQPLRTPVVLGLISSGYVQTTWHEPTAES